MITELFDAKDRKPNKLMTIDMAERVCHICKKQYTIKNDGGFVFHTQFGFACNHHKGVLELFNNIWIIANLKLDGKM